MAQTPDSLRRQLDLYAGPALATMLKARGAYQKQTIKKDIVNALIKVIGDESGTRIAFDQLRNEQKVLLRLLREMGGNATVHALRLAANAVGMGNFDAHLGELMRQALVLFNTPGNVRHELWRADDGRYSNWNLNPQYGIAGVEKALEMADDSIALPKITHELEVYQGEPYSSAEQSPATLLHVVWSVVRWASEREITLTKTEGTLRKADLKVLDAQLKEQTELKGFALALAFEVGLLTQKREKITATPQASAFFGQPAHAQIEKLFAAWLRLQGWSEFFRIPEIETDYETVPQPQTQHWGYNVGGDIPNTQTLPAARAYLVGILKRVGAVNWGQWQALTSLRDLIKTENAEFLIPPETKLPYYSNSRTAGHYAGFWPAGENRWRAAFERGKDWDKVEGRFIRQLLTEPLLWLGVTAIGRDQNNEAVAFRLSPLGAHLLGLTKELPAETADEKPLIIQPNFEILAYTQAGNLQVLYQLERFATRERAERVAHYKLDRDSVYRGLQDGLSATQMREFLETHSRSGVPQNIAYSLDDWQNQWESVTVWPSASIIETDTPAEMDALIATLSEAAIRRLAPTWAVVEPKHLQAARNYLTGSRGSRALDYGLDVEQTFVTNDDLEIVVPADNLDLWLRAKIERFADAVIDAKDHARFRITRDSLARAANSGLKADDVLNFLATIGTPPIPANVTLTVRGWSGEIAPVSLGAVQVLSADTEVIAQIASVAELRKLLWLRAGDGAALVKSADVPKLKAALKRRGIAFDGEATTHLKAPRAPKAEKTQPRRRPANRSVAVDNGIGARLKPRQVAAHPDEDDIELQSGLSESDIETLLEGAIEQSVCVVIEYQSKARKAIRKISPLEVFGDGGNIYVGAYDHWRKAGRVFRIDRITRIAVTDDKFDPEQFE